MALSKITHSFSTPYLLYRKLYAALCSVLIGSMSTRLQCKMGYIAWQVYIRCTLANQYIPWPIRCCPGHMHVHPLANQMIPRSNNVPAGTIVREVKKMPKCGVVVAISRDNTTNFFSQYCILH